MTASLQTPAPPGSPFAVGDLVMFARRTQVTTAGMPVQAVDANMFDVLLKVNDRWWHPGSFISLQQWRHQVVAPA